jgi:chromosomal replication initiation ATPase DnaA
MQDIEQRLLSRFKWGLSRIAPTGLRNKNFYLEKISEWVLVEIPEEIAEYACNATSNRT